MRNLTGSKSVHSLSLSSKRRRAPRVLAAAIEALEPRRLLSAGQLDPTFGINGQVSDLTHPGASSLAVQTDGKIVEAGLAIYSGQTVLSLARFNVDGTPDQSFGYRGGLTQVLGAYGQVGDVAIQTDGKILVDVNGGVERFLSSGQVDTNFGTGGKTAGTNGSLHFALQPDGKIDVAGGTSMYLGGDFASGTVTITRFNTDGSLDTGFGTGGTVSTGAAGIPTVDGIALQSDGTIVVAGSATQLVAIPSTFADRFTSTGVFSGFFGGGIAGFTAVATQGNKVIVYSQATSALERHNADGSLDTTFTSIPDQTNSINQLLVQPDGKILASATQDSGPPRYLGYFVVERFNADGTLDTTFGKGDRTINNFSDFGTSASIALAPGGAIVEAGGTAHQLDIARYTGDSAIVQPGASITGHVYLDLNGTHDPNQAGAAGRKVYIDLQGNDIYSGGDPVAVTDANGNFTFAGLAAGTYTLRLVPNSDITTLPAGNGQGDGEYTISLAANQADGGYNFGTLPITAKTISITQPDGKRLVGGLTPAVGAPYVLTVVRRVNPDGSLDLSFGTNGVASTGLVGYNSQGNFSAAVTSLSLAANGSVIVGSAFSGGQIPTETDYVTLLDSNGTAVRSDIVATSGGAFSYNAVKPVNVVVLPNGKILVTESDSVNGVVSGAAFTRYNSDLTRDTTFGINGDVNHSYTGPLDTLNQTELASNPLNILPQNDGSILLIYPSDTITLDSTGAIDPLKLIAAPTGLTATALSPTTVQLQFTDNSPNEHSFVIQRPISSNGVPNWETIAALPGTPGTGVRAYVDTTVQAGRPYNYRVYATAGVVTSPAANASVVTPTATGSSVSGSVYSVGNIQKDVGVAPVAGREVYLDLNGVGVFATGDPISTTDAAGHYSFLNLPPKNYLVRLVPQAGTVITMPLFGGKYFVQLGANQTITGDDFGTQAVGSPSFPLAGGQLLVSGSANSHNTLARYNADGSVDVAFGTSGIVTLPSNVVGVPSNALSQPNGQIVITYPTLTVTLSATGAIVSISSISGGTISGKVYNDLNDDHVRDAGDAPVAGRQVYLDIPGIDVYVAGDPVALTDANGNYSFGGLAAGNYLVRLVPVSGQVVSSPIFGGKYYVQLGANQTVTGDNFGTLAVGPFTLTMPDGKLVVANPFRYFDPFISPLYDLTRYNPDGSIDTNFGVLGNANIGATTLSGTPGAGISQLLSRPDGSLIVHWIGNSRSSTTHWLTLFDPSGAVLHTVAIGFQFRDQFGTDTIEGIASTADNKVVVAYQHDDPTPAHSKFVRRYNADLTLDQTFGTNGQATVTGAPDVPLTKMTPLANGEIVLNYGGTLLLLQSNGSVDTTNAVALLPDGKLLVGGQIFRTATLTRYNADGSVDTTFNGGTSYEGNIHQIILLPNGAYVLWEQGGRGPLHESVEFITSFGQSKGTQTVAVNTSGNSGNTTQTITSVRAINGGVEVVGTQVQTIYSFSPTIPNTVITTPIDAMYFVGYTNQ
jgi:uncharacterized delta-60 repeat protein